MGTEDQPSHRLESVLAPAIAVGFEYDEQVPVSLRNMIGRSFVAEDAQDQIRAAVIDLLEVLELDSSIDVAEVCTMT